MYLHCFGVLNDKYHRMFMFIQMRLPVFLSSLFILSAIINFIWITKNDDRTVFEKFGSTFDLRCGVHRMRHRPNKSWKRVQLIDNQDV
ncbi:unnamed protein product [Brugia timori]|uniref:Transmembrane protein n=1 Tax=Brugia timori TaxID=42155 RepID=A0A0R3QPT0_9BILA|nr:unnamed protein product [Brugia timori]